MPLTISATALGELAQSDLCPRCFWIKRNCKLPYQTFPGIFSSIDAYVKRVVHRYFERERRLPDWFPALRLGSGHASGQVVGLEQVPHYTKFSVTDPKSGVTLRGEPDDVLRLEDSQYHIVDYKTARFSANAGAMYPVYEVQLNAYAYIGQRTLFSPVSGLSLIYLDPDTDLDSFPEWLNRSEGDFTLGFTPKQRLVELKPDSFVEELMRQASEIAGSEAPPEPASGCRDCDALEQLLELAKSGG